MNKQNFIKTSDETTAELLKSENFELIDYSNGIWTFINNPTMTFDDKKVKITYSNMLTV